MLLKSLVKKIQYLNAKDVYLDYLHLNNIFQTIYRFWYLDRRKKE